MHRIYFPFIKKLQEQRIHRIKRRTGLRRQGRHYHQHKMKHAKTRYHRHKMKWKDNVEKGHISMMTACPYPRMQKYYSRKNSSTKEKFLICNPILPSFQSKAWIWRKEWRISTRVSCLMSLKGASRRVSTFNQYRSPWSEHWLTFCRYSEKQPTLAHGKRAKRLKEIFSSESAAEQISITSVPTAS